MRLVIIGLSNSGKTTVFSALTGQNIEATIYPTTSGEPHIGSVHVPDTRLDQLSEIFKPKKTVYAMIEYIDYIGITKGNIEQNTKVFDFIKSADAIVHVVRAFEDPTVVHPIGNTNPFRDVETVEIELIFGDLEFVEKRLERIEQGKQRGKKPDELDLKVLMKCRDYLQGEIPLRDTEFTIDEQNAMKPLQFVSNKPEIAVLNIGEKDINSDRIKDIKASLQTKYPSVSFLQLCGKIEMEISRFSSDDANLFLADYGLAEPASRKLIRACYNALGLISFFTYAGNEVKAWTIERGTTAQRAAGKVHSDIERGFIRAEVISFDDFIPIGNISVARENGLLRLEGKTYEVKDGDVINFRFNV